MSHSSNDSSTEYDDEGGSPPPKIISLSSLRGVTFRKRVDPSTTKSRDEYKITRHTKHTIKGKRVLFEISRNGKILYSTKMKGRRPDEPLPIAKGAEMHYSSKSFAAYLLSGNGHKSYSLRAQTTFGKELLTVAMELTNGEKMLPKTVTVTFFLKDSLIPTKLVNMQPTFHDDGVFTLNFGGKEAVTSIKNCILINQENKVEFLMVRKTSKDVVMADAVNVMSPLSVFAIVLTLFETPF